jgi:alkylresorcinol/alkylpyrone synthase
MFITGLGTATPPNRYTQVECWQALMASGYLPRLKPRSQAILRKVLMGNNGICSRYLAFDHLSEAFELTPDALHARFATHAPAAAALAAERALLDSGTATDEIDAVIISTCTGYLCPGLTSYVVERLGLPTNVLTLDLVGQGCGAALPNMRAGDALIAAGRCRRVLSICVEICSAALYLDDDPGVLISACLFGDGAGAAVLSNEAPSGKRRVEWKAAASTVGPADRDELRFRLSGGMLRNILTQEVPALAAKYVGSVLDRVLTDNGLRQESISTWIMHAGGREILQAIREELGLGEHDVRWSADVLRNYGNVSSPCVYFVLQKTLNDFVAGGLWWMSSFGAGFSCGGALLEVE